MGIGHQVEVATRGSSTALVFMPRSLQQKCLATQIVVFCKLSQNQFQIMGMMTMNAVIIFYLYSWACKNYKINETKKYIYIGIRTTQSNLKANQAKQHNCKNVFSEPVLLFQIVLQYFTCFYDWVYSQLPLRRTRSVPAPTVHLRECPPWREMK